MKKVMIVLILACSFAAAASEKEVETLTAVQVPAIGGLGPAKISYTTGGCNAGKTDYRLELVAKNIRPGDISEIFISAKVRVIDAGVGSCRALIHIQDEVDLTELVMNNLEALGVAGLDFKKNFVIVSLEFPPVVGSVHLIEEEDDDDEVEILPAATH